MPITPRSALAPRDGLIEGTGTFHGLVYVVLKFVMGEISCL
jgi:hypothetical protein